MACQQTSCWLNGLLHWLHTGREQHLTWHVQEFTKVWTFQNPSTTSCTIINYCKFVGDAIIDKHQPEDGQALFDRPVENTTKTSCHAPLGFLLDHQVAAPLTLIVFFSVALFLVLEPFCDKRRLPLRLRLLLFLFVVSCNSGCSSFSLCLLIKARIKNS